MISTYTKDFSWEKKKDQIWQILKKKKKFKTPGFYDNFQ
jgi:hypothetical protein